MKAFSKQLKELREEKGLSRKELAKNLFVSSSAISNWEMGIRFPHIEILIKIADFFDVSLDYLVGREIYLR